jgi:hypothetical protein
LIFTNHADAMVLPDDCRRTFVVENPSVRQDYAYYDRLAGALQTQEPRRVYWWLMHRDVSEYDRIYPPMTAAKARMIEDTRAPSDGIADWITEHHASDLVTKATLKTAVLRAAAELDHEKIMRDAETQAGIVKMLWKKLRTLRSEDKHGARYVLNGKQTEVRALRRREHWTEIDLLRSTTTVETELNKSVVNDNIVQIRPGG